MKAYVTFNTACSPETLMEAVIKDKELFTPITIIKDQIYYKVYLDPLYKGDTSHCTSTASLIAPFLDQLRFNKDALIRHFALSKLDWISVDTNVNVMGNGDDIAPHVDSFKLFYSNVELIFLLYFFSSPKKYTGGELVLHWPDGDEIIEPENNKMVIFPGTIPHSVHRVSIEDNAFENRRFVISGRILATPTLTMKLVRLFNKMLKPVRKVALFIFRNTLRN